MAEVTLQVKVLREQLDKLQADINKLKTTKITMDASSANQSVREAEKTTRELLKTQKEAARAAEAMAKAEKANVATRKEAARASEAQAKADKAKVAVQREEIKADKDWFQAEKEKIRLEREAAKQSRETQREEERHAKSVEKQSFAYKILGRSVGEFMLRMTAYRAVYASIRAITNGFTEALETLKAVDDELVTVRKVTGFDAAQMAGVESQAYAVASKYGASASDYVSGVAAFARAGYKDLSGDLAELAQKTIIVGDTTAEVANQFLLSVDAAYKFNGSVRELSKVLDAANELDNKYATSIEKIAEGMGIVAPVAAQMNVDVYELEAAIGTITAVTQRTGTEAARALRAIMLNIVGDTKTEIEEGVTWTTGEIAGLKDIIKQYAPEAYKAAQATGSIIDPMKAIGGLAQSMKDGLLTEQQLMEMVSDIGGKLRTSQLLALIQNWDMYNSMLEDTKNAVGSADKEIANAMDSWTRKTNVLKNTWTEFVKTGLDSSFFKNALDGVTWLVERLDSLPAILARIILLVAALKLGDIVQGLKKAKDAAVAFARGLKEVGTSASSLNWVSAAIMAIAIAWQAYSMAQEDAKIKHQQMVESIYEEAEAARQSTNNVIDLYAEFYSAAEGSDEFAESAKRLAEILGVDLPEGVEETKKALQRLTLQEIIDNNAKLNTAVEVAKKEMIDAVSDTAKTEDYFMLFSPTNVNTPGGLGADVPAQIQDYVSSLLANFGISKVYEAGGGEAKVFDTSDIESALAFRDAMQEVSKAIDRYVQDTKETSILDTEYYKQLQAYLQNTAGAYDDLAQKSDELTSGQRKERFLSYLQTVKIDSVEAYKRSSDAIQENTAYTDEERDLYGELLAQYFPQYAAALEENTEATEDHTEAVEGETESLFANQEALDENASATDRATAAKKDAEAAVAAHMDALFDETGALTEAGAAAFAASQYLADLANAELNARKEAAQANYAALRAELAGVSAQALKAAYALLAIEAAVGDGDGIVVNEYNRIAGKAGRAAEILRQLQAIEAEMASITAASQAVAPYASSSSSGKGSGGGKSSGGKSSGGKSSGKSSSTEDAKLKALQERLKLLQSELALMKERGDSEEDQIAKMREIQDALKAEWEYLEKIKGDKATINDLEREWWQYENSITEMMEKQAQAEKEKAEAMQKALDAQIALNNALKDRSVRYYNAETGQWEWGANQENVDSARKALEDAAAAAGMTMEEWEKYYALINPLGKIANRDAPLSWGGLSSAWDASALNRGGTSNTSFGTNNYGATYNIAGVTLSESQARSMTIYELAQLSGNLAIQNRSV